VEVVGWCSAVDHLPVGRLDLRAQVAAREPVLVVNLHTNNESNNVDCHTDFHHASIQQSARLCQCQNNL
jgi:hypothetical protein